MYVTGISQPVPNGSQAHALPCKSTSLRGCAVVAQAFVDKFRYNAKRASLVQSRIKAIERMADVELVEADPEYCFRCAPGQGLLS